MSASFIGLQETPHVWRINFVYLALRTMSNNRVNAQSSGQHLVRVAGAVSVSVAGGAIAVCSGAVSVAGRGVSV